MKKTLIIAIVAVLAIAVAILLIKKGDTRKPAVGNSVETLADEINASRKHDTALLLVTFGSSWEAPQETFRKIKESFADSFPDTDVYFSFTSGVCIRRCAEKGWIYHSPSTYIQAIGLAGYKTVCIQSLHIIPGEEYLKIQKIAEDFHKDPEHPEFADVKIYTAGPLLASQSDVEEVASFLHRQHGKDIMSGKTVTFMGHGNTKTQHYVEANSRYTMLEKELQKFSPYYFVATVDMENNLVTDMIERIRNSGKVSGEVICHPLVSIVGDHANNDMTGGKAENNPEEGSWRYELCKAGYYCPLENCGTKGLADYPEIVEIWINQMKKAMASAPLYD